MAERVFISMLPLFEDRAQAGRLLAAELERLRGEDMVVIGLARGGVVVAAEVARGLGAPLDVVAVRKVGHPIAPEYALGAVAPDDGVYVRAHDGLTDAELEAVVAHAKAQAAALDEGLHAKTPPCDLAGKTALLVDDGLATGATMIAAIRWARSRGAGRVVAAVPVAAIESLALVRDEADEAVCLYDLEEFLAVSVWYRAFDQVGDGEVLRLLAEAPRTVSQKAKEAEA